MKYNLDLSMKKVTKISCVTVLLSERNYYKYKQKLAKKLEKIQKEKNDTNVWLEVQTIKNRMSHIFSVGKKNQRPIYKNE